MLYLRYFLFRLYTAVPHIPAPETNSKTIQRAALLLSSVHGTSVVWLSVYTKAQEKFVGFKYRLFSLLQSASNFFYIIMKKVKLEIKSKLHFFSFIQLPLLILTSNPKKQLISYSLIGSTAPFFTNSGISSIGADTFTVCPPSYSSPLHTFTHFAP